MNTVQLRVELPTHSHSFLVQVSEASTILDVKREIFRVCIGAPQVDGQRLILRGRFLKDEERIQELWKSSDEPRIVHLSVHPSAWSASPPSTEGSAVNITPQPTPTYSSGLQSPISRLSNHLTYVRQLHENAIKALRGQPPASLARFALSKGSSIQFVQEKRFSWPDVLNQEFPPFTNGGVKYDYVTVDGRSCLQLIDSDAEPTPLQLHALEVLSYTTTILKLPPPTTIPSHPVPSHTVHIPPQNIPGHLHMVLQQLGLPPIGDQPVPVPNLHPPNARANVNRANLEIHIRPIVFPLAMLLLRVGLLFYFFSPSRTPVIFIPILLFVAYELYRAVRVERRPVGNQPAVDREQPAFQDNQNRAEGNIVNNNPAAAPAPVRPAQGSAVDAVLDTFANLDLEAEDRALQGQDIQEPTTIRKVTTFFGLLAATLHPAIWDRRREILRRREGTIRTEARLRDNEVDGEEGPERDTRLQRQRELIAQYEARPRWIQDYMRRVVVNDVVEEID